MARGSGGAQRPPAADYDFLIVGSGIAGLFTAVLASAHGRVAVVTKGTLAQTNTRWAQGGIAAAIADNDSADLHERDTLVAGAGLCDPAAVKVLCEEGPARVRDLIRLGVDFDTVDGVISLAMEGAHSLPRVLHARGDATGAEIEHALTRRVSRAGADLFQHTLLLDLLVSNGHCEGADVLDLRSGERRELRARHTVLATGGGGQLFEHTTNPNVATADGVAAALRAGAAVADLEFFQFHPTALMKPGAPRFLITEAARGEGALLLNSQGERFMPRYDDRAELAPRDVVARAIVRELDATGAPHVLLDLTHLDPARVEGHFPTIARVCRRYGIEITRQPIPVAPAAHYMIGGVLADVWGRTTVPGLYVCGEAASAGVHGANRLASNSLLEAVVFGQRIVEASTRTEPPAEESAADPPIETFELADFIGESERAEHAQRARPLAKPARGSGGAQRPPAATTPGVRRALWRRVGITRDGASLTQVERDLQSWLTGYRPQPTRRSVELANMLLVGWLMARAARVREESRGAHYRADFTATHPEWRKRLAIRLRGYPRLLA